MCYAAVVVSTGSRPKHLLVYINPFGGKRRGKRVYEQKVAPLFAQAGVSTHVIGTTRIVLSLFFKVLASWVSVCVVIVTEYANHARDHLRTGAELKKYDG